MGGGDETGKRWEEVVKQAKGGGGETGKRCEEVVKQAKGGRR